MPVRERFLPRPSVFALKNETAAQCARPEESGKKAFFSALFGPYGLKRTEFPTEIALKGRGDDAGGGQRDPVMQLPAE